MLVTASKAAIGASTNFGSTLKIFRLTRIVRVAKLSSYSRSLRILATTVYHSTPMLIQLAIIQLSLALVFAVMTYFFERDAPNRKEENFRDMTDAMWWALITMVSLHLYCHLQYTHLVHHRLWGSSSCYLCRENGGYFLCHSWPARYGIFATHHCFRKVYLNDPISD